MGDDLTWDNWVKTMEALQGFETEASPVPIGYKAFAEGDPGTRRGASRCNFSHLTPGGEGLDTSVVKDWSEWEDLSRAG